MQVLSEFQKGVEIKIKSIDCGKNFKRRLIELGLFVGAEVQIIKNDKFGPLIIKIFDSQIALGRGEAEKIYGEKI